MAGQLTSETLLDLQSNIDEERGKKTQIRVVDWISESEKGTKHFPQLEKREFFRAEDSDMWKTGKAKGLNGKDFLLVILNWKRIAGLLGVDQQFVIEAFDSAPMANAPPAAPKPRTSTGPAKPDPYHDRPATAPADDDF